MAGYVPVHVPTETQVCIERASERYSIPAPLIRAVLHVEAGGRGVVAVNRNGTEDLGWGQINSSWLPKLAAYGISRQDLLDDPCTNIGVSAWIMRMNADQYQDWTHAIAAYNAGTHLNLGMPYARKVIKQWRMELGMATE